MASNLRRKGVVPAIILLLVVASLTGFYFVRQQQQQQAKSGTASSTSCPDPLGTSKTLRTQLAPPSTFGGVTEFALPTPLRDPISPVVAPDGSVWFAEQSVPGLAHFYPGNRTLVEYAFPYSYPALSSPSGGCATETETQTWGVALSDGKVWASDTAENQLVALDPSTGQFSTVKLPTSNSYPYTLTPGPNGSLWFTELFSGKIGELSANGTLREYPVPGGAAAEPAQVVFANATTGYYSAIDGAGADTGGVYSFNLTDFSPQLLGGQMLTAPTSITLADGALWVALHGSSSVGSYSFAAKSWSYYPTTPVSYYPTTLPYFVDANGTSVWVNEHFGNRMAVIDPANGTLTEYAESNVPVNGTTIGNTVTFGLASGGAWFAEWSGNILGYTSASYNPGFYTSIAGNSTVVVPRNSSTTVDLVVHDTTHQGPLNLSFADSESFTSTPSNMTFGVPSMTVSAPAGGATTVAVTVAALGSLKPGTYTAILTATDGLTYESSFIKIVVP